MPLIRFVSVEKGNFLYFFFIFLLLFLVVFFRLIAKNRGQAWTRKFILALMWGNFILHFAKQLNPCYLMNFPFSFGRSSLENLCAVLICISPFIFLWGNDYLKDYVFYLGIVSGVLVYFLPTGALGKDLGDMDNLLEAIRFYSCHAPLVICGFLMVDRGLHKLNYHRLWAVPITFVAINFFVVLNAFFMSFVIRYPDWPHTLEAFFDRDGFVNQSASFGPPTSLDSIIGWAYPYLPPILMTIRIDGVIYFTPSLYLLLPVALATLILGPLMSLPYERRHFLLDREAMKQKKAMKKKAVALP